MDTMTVEVAGYFASNWDVLLKAALASVGFISLPIIIVYGLKDHIDFGI